MNSTRRTFLKTAVTLTAALPLARLPLGAADGTVPSAASSAPAGGLLFDPAELPHIRANLELPRLAELRAMLKGIDLEAETNFLREQLRLNNHVVDFMRAWQAVQNCSFAHAVWGEQAHLDVALLALRRLCDYKRWDYFLEGGKDTIGLQRAPEATIACCYALDWLGEKVPADLRAKVEEKIVTEGAPACYRTLYGMKYPDRVRGWGFDPEDDYQFRYDLSRWPLILNATNLKIIPTCGLGLAAAWFHGRHPDAAKWLELSRQSARAFATMYGDDGSYDEGVGYWGYTTMHLAMVAEALHRRLGLEDRKLINYPGTIRYALTMAMPCAGEPISDPNLNKAYNATPKYTYQPEFDLVNFCDSGGAMDVSVAAWVAGINSDPISQHVAANIGTLRHLQAAVWYRAKLPVQAPGADLDDVRLSNDWVVARTGWKPQDIVVAFRSGGPANHEHADRNSVILKAHGERLFHDPFKAGYSPTLPRWLLRQTEAHTAVLIAGKGHQYHDGKEGTNSSWASARILDFRTGNDWMLATSDATEAYALVLPDTMRVLRTVVLLKPDVLLLLDQVELKTSAAVQVRFQVFNEDNKATAVADGMTFRIARPLASAHATVAARGNFRIGTGKLALPDSDGTFPYVEVESAPATRHTLLTATTTAPAGSAHGALALESFGEGWRITGQHLGRTIRATLEIPSDGLPRLKV
ncbi:MAG: hypothetical protein C0518_07090 [Opitutus sp.]|nr:hypothetical protein [Opitutus sp.]